MLFFGKHEISEKSGLKRIFDYFFTTGHHIRDICDNFRL